MRRGTKSATTPPQNDIPPEKKSYRRERWQNNRSRRRKSGEGGRHPKSSRGNNKNNNSERSSKSIVVCRIYRKCLHLESEEEDEKVNNNGNKSGRSRAEKALLEVQTKSSPASPARDETKQLSVKTRILFSSISRTQFSPHPQPFPRKNEETISQWGERISL